MLSLFLPVLLLAPLTSAPASIALLAEEPWLEEFDRAQALARETNRDLLVDFTGSDWCTWCKKLDREVLGTSVFQQKAAQDYVLVKVDLPRSPAGLKTVPNIKLNRKLSRDYKIQKFPTVLLMTPDGHVYGSSGYVASGALGYWNELAEQRLKNRGPLVEAIGLAKRFATADAESKVQIAARSLILLPQLPPASSVVPLMIPAVGHYLQLDPDNAAGDLGRALRVLLPSGYALPEHLAVARKLDPQNEQGLRELALLADAYAVQNERDQRRVAKAVLALDALGPIQDPQAALVLYGNGALWVERVLRETEKAQGLARKALPYTSGRQIEGALQQLLNK